MENKRKKGIIEAFYNTLRPHSSIGWLSPCAFELRLRNASAA